MRKKEKKKYVKLGKLGDTIVFDNLYKQVTGSKWERLRYFLEREKKEKRKNIKLSKLTTGHKCV